MDNEIEKSFYTIGEVASMLNESISRIRFWEKEFPQLHPLKTEGGTRKYTQKDIQFLKLIHHLVKEKGFTLEGARTYIKQQPKVNEQAILIDKLKDIKAFLVDLKDQIK